MNTALSIPWTQPRADHGHRGLRHHGANHAGKMESISYSLGYTAPEVLLALEAGQKLIRVDPAVDVWALGVIACAPILEQSLVIASVGSLFKACSRR